MFVSLHELKSRFGYLKLLFFLNTEISTEMVIEIKENATKQLTDHDTEKSAYFENSNHSIIHVCQLPPTKVQI